MWISSISFSLVWPLVNCVFSSIASLDTVANWLPGKQVLQLHHRPLSFAFHDELWTNGRTYCALLLLFSQSKAYKPCELKAAGSACWELVSWLNAYYFLGSFVTAFAVLKCWHISSRYICTVDSYFLLVKLGVKWWKCYSHCLKRLTAYEHIYKIWFNEVRSPKSLTTSSKLTIFQPETMPLILRSCEPWCVICEEMYFHWRLFSVA